LLGRDRFRELISHLACDDSGAIQVAHWWPAAAGRFLANGRTDHWARSTESRKKGISHINAEARWFLIWPVIGHPSRRPMRATADAGMNLLDRKQQEEFFQEYLTRMLPRGSSVHIAESSYEEDRSALCYRTPAGALVVCINDIEKPETDVPHRTGFVARLLSEIGQQQPEEYIRTAIGLFKGTYADFDAPVICPGGAEIFAWDSTRRIWPRPFYIRRWVEGRNLAVIPRASYFRQTGEALRRFHRIRFKKWYPSFRDVEKAEPSSATELFGIGRCLEAVEPLLPLATLSAVTKLETDPETVVVGLLNNSFFGNNVLIDNFGHVRVLDWEKAGIGDLAQDFFPLKYWTVVEKRSGWYMPNAGLFEAFCKGYGTSDVEALRSRPTYRYLEAQWLLQRLGAASRRWRQGAVQEPYPEPDFYVSSLRQLLDV
jgi:aminoglycoside phosphotransferase (APT) family kinase protein